MKSRRSWLVIAGVALVLGAYAAYYAFMHDWRGSFTAEQLSLEAGVSGETLTLVLRNTGSNTLMVWNAPRPASPFDISIEAAGGPAMKSPDCAITSSGGARQLPGGSQIACSGSLRELFPGAPPGRHLLYAVYDPAGAAERNEPCAAELTLGRVRAEPVEVRF